MREKAKQQDTEKKKKPTTQERRWVTVLKPREDIKLRDYCRKQEMRPAQAIRQAVKKFLEDREKTVGLWK